MANPLFSLIKRKKETRTRGDCKILDKEYLPTFAFTRNGAVIRPEFIVLASVYIFHQLKNLLLYNPSAFSQFFIFNMYKSRK